MHALWKQDSVSQEFATFHASIHKWDMTTDEIDNAERFFAEWMVRFKQMHKVSPYLHAVAAHLFALARKYGGVGKFNNQGVEGKNAQQTRECRRNVAYGRACQQILQREHRQLLAREEGLLGQKRKYVCTRRKKGRFSLLSRGEGVDV